MTTPNDKQPEILPPLKPPRATAQEIRNELEPPIMPGGDNNMNTRPKFGGGIIQTIVIAIVVALIVFVGMGQFGGGGFVTKKDFTTNMQGMVTSLDQAKVSLADSKKAVDTALAGISDKVNTALNISVVQINSNIANLVGKIDTAQSQIQNAINNSNDALGKSNTASGNIATINNSLNEIQSDITSLQSSIATLTTRISGLETRVTTLETIPTTPPPTSSILPFTYVMLVTNDGDATSGTDNTTILSVKLTLENKTDKALEDIGIVIPIEIDAVQDMTSFNMAVSGWTIQKYGIKYLLLKGHGMKLNANEKKRIYFDITLNFPVAISTGYWSGYVIEDDIEILSWDYK